ncbi:dipeptidase PepE [Verminephrobacter eiseniae]|uniref:dipeptidase E n=1 Tax=Verminephrobacter eiseniae (strain EF01-2) TaxID=391735 RepID=A1WN21_VEREI|nr:dipeptidase PepE [Verminephrobacter eiseniae]ABM59028.1 dipeptidase E. Serine peptidase. MEROPS family S51 [Verminephrobacter eiseniae EF01-2]MCW5284584.1 dipeptidase PepE [Verminephrobacter eiseniae]MCW5302290.1 dipeptidase PepE [Verminephrobacter eiseniae]MCW8179637.1 dipeptidase PepE [Verminephrobacter eiseniae]MCW8191354.1 dipeptidase PepE [Verminephrobacter eiseniae]
MRLLLLSNSINPGGAYLQHALAAVEKINRRRAIFIPYAGVTIGWDDYLNKVRQALAPIGIHVDGVHQSDDPVAAIQGAELILGGGGNTWRLLQLVRQHGLLEAIRAKVAVGTPYIGWSAGTNLACPTIRTTNDMPIVDPKGFDALNLLPFQINPHYNNELPAGHQGETRSQRIAEFTRINPDMPVLGLPEGDWLEVDGQQTVLCGPKPALLFKEGNEPREIHAGDLSFLMARQIEATPGTRGTE